MSIKIAIVVIIFLQLIFFEGAAQKNDLKFNLVESPNNKPLGKINAISQDTHGYIWLAGSGERCLYRYDGNRINSFHDVSPLKVSDCVSALRRPSLVLEGAAAAASPRTDGPSRQAPASSPRRLISPVG